MVLSRRLLGVLLAGITLLLMATGVPAATVPVSVLMPASFADASARLVREFNASHLGNIMHGRQGLHETAHEVGCSTLSVWAIAGIPNGDLVDLEVLDSFNLSLNHGVDLLNHEECGGGLGIPTGAGNQSLVTGGLGFENLLDTFRFGFIISHNSVS